MSVPDPTSAKVLAACGHEVLRHDFDIATGLCPTCYERSVGEPLPQPIWQAGFDACKAGKSAADNPHKKASNDWWEWNTGFNEATGEL